MATANGVIARYSTKLTTLANEEPMLVASSVVALVFVILYWKFGEFWNNKHEEKEYEPTDWEKKIPNYLKKMAKNGGFSTEKELWHGDHEAKGMVFLYDIQTMPKDIDYMEYLFGDYDKSDFDDEDMEDVYIFITREIGNIDKLTKASWKVTDQAFGKYKKTNFFIIRAENVEEERGRFKFNENVQFKMEYSNILTEKGMTTEAVTDQFPLYKARKNIVEGIEEFSMKTLFLDRKHSSQVAQMREDVDEEALKRLLGQGKNF